jgi:hypothetical protein
VTLFLNGLRASSVRLITPWTGAWAADVDVDLGALPDLTPGPALLTIGTTSLVGTIDPAQSGRFGPRARARVVAGAGGWEKTVTAKHYHNDGGVLSAAVLQTTAAQVLERVVEVVPRRFGIDFVRPAGPAAGVLRGLSWYVNAAGVTIVGPRIPTPAIPTSVKVLAWDARSKVATIATEDVLSPGTILADLRFGTAKVRDVEQTWGDGGARATAWTIAVDETPGTDGGNELVGIIGAIAREAAGSQFLAAVKYRVLSQLPDGRFMLEADEKSEKHPDLKAISLAPAVPGMSVKVPPGTMLHVVFVDGDRSSPVVVRFEEGPTPIEVSIDAVRVAVGSPGAEPVALAPGVLALAAALGDYAQALKALGPLVITTPAADALATALAPITALTTSKKLFAE